MVRQVEEHEHDINQAILRFNYWCNIYEGHHASLDSNSIYASIMCSA
jgi:hypothetical protein